MQDFLAGDSPGRDFLGQPSPGRHGGDRLARHNATAYPVRDFDGQLSGLVTLTQLLAVPENRRGGTRLSQVATPVTYLTFTTLDEPLADLRFRLAHGEQSRPGSPATLHIPAHALVLGPSGELAGLLTPADLAQAVQSGALRAATAGAGPGAALTPTRGSPCCTTPSMCPCGYGVSALAVVLAVAAADVLLASRSRGHEPGLREAALCTAGVVTLGALFGLALAGVAGPKASGQFYAGWLTEYSLSLDNLFVFVLLIGRSGVAGRLRSRVLLAGIGLALLLRAVFIAAGAAALNRFDWVLYIFGAILLVTAVRMAAGRGGPPDPASAGPSLPGPGKLRRGIAGRLKSHRHGALLALIAAIAGADVVFAMDSIPAVFGLTRDPYLVLAANVFALLGLRHLYFLIGGLAGPAGAPDGGTVGDPRVHRGEADRRGALRFRGARGRARAGAARQYLGIPGRHRRRAGRGHGDQPAGHPAPGRAGRSALPGQGTQLSGHLARRDLPSLTGSPARSAPTRPSASPRLPHGDPVRDTGQLRIAELHPRPARAGRR